MLWHALVAQICVGCLRPPWPQFGIGLFAVAAALWVVSMFILFSTVSSVTQPAATVLGSAAVFGAGLVTFKYARESRISAAQTAADALSHAQTVAAAERVQFEEQLAAQREQTERSLAQQASATALTLERQLVRDLRSRYPTAAEQLAHSSAAIRLAGVYALAALADDWDQHGESVRLSGCRNIQEAIRRTFGICLLAGAAPMVRRGLK